MCGFIAQLVEQRTGNAEVTGSNPVEALIFFFRLLLSNCFNWKIYCDDHSSLSYFSVISRFPLKTVHTFQNFLAVLPPSTLYKVETRKNYGYTRATLFVR